jgi:hypothetical protein
MFVEMKFNPIFSTSERSHVIDFQLFNLRTHVF